MRAQAYRGERGCGEMGPTMFVEMTETLGTPASHFHMPSSSLLSFFFGTAFSATPHVTLPVAVWAEGFREAAKESR